MSSVPEPIEVGDELWFTTPPGWIELVAHADDESAARWFDRLLAKTPDAWGESGADRLRETFAEVRRNLPDTGLDAAGVLVTSFDDELTLWQFSVAVITLPPSGDVNPMAVVEQFVTSPEGRRPLTSDDDLVETFQTPDGRDGVAIHTTTQTDDGDHLTAHVPGADPDRLGVVYAAVRLNRVRGADRDRLAVIVGVAPTVEQRLAMSIIAAQITVSARLRDSDADPLPGRIDVDATGRRRDEES